MFIKSKKNLKTSKLKKKMEKNSKNHNIFFNHKKNPTNPKKNIKKCKKKNLFSYKKYLKISFFFHLKKNDKKCFYLSFAI